MASSTVSTSDVEATRFHLGYGNVDAGAYPFTPDGFLELFEDVIAPNLTTGDETSATTTITAGADATVTPASMVGIAAHARLVVDVGDLAEIVTVRAVTATTFTARFVNAHPSTGYPIAVESGVTRLRILLHRAAQAWERVQGSSIAKTAGLKSVGRGAVEWFGSGTVLTETQTQYVAIVEQLSALVRVPRAGHARGRASTLESY
jgi:hypothetical protein